MAFWDDFGKRAGETARNIGLRAREVAETTKLNGQIAVKKTEEERLYARIGKAYCLARSGAEGGEDPESLCREVEGIQGEIARLQEQIDRARQVRRCKKCGEVSPRTSRFCAACGERFEDEPEPAEPEQHAEEAPQENVEINWPEPSEETPQEAGEQPAESAPAPEEDPKAE